MDDYYCTSTIKNNVRLQVIKDKRDTMNLIINNAKGMVFFQTQFQKGDFVVNVQQKDYDQNPRKVVRNSGTTALDVSRLKWREIKSEGK
jgi:type II secretory pathway component PulC